MTDDADRCGMPTGIPGGCPLPGNHQGSCQPEPTPGQLRYAALDPVIVRERLAELERRRDVQEQVVTRLDELLCDEQRELLSIERELRDLRAHPAVIAALADPAAAL